MLAFTFGVAFSMGLKNLQPVFIIEVFYTIFAQPWKYFGSMFSSSLSSYPYNHQCFYCLRSFPFPECLLVEIAVMYNLLKWFISFSNIYWIFITYYRTFWLLSEFGPYGQAVQTHVHTFSSKHKFSVHLREHQRAQLLDWCGKEGCISFCEKLAKGFPKSLGRSACPSLAPVTLHPRWHLVALGCGLETFQQMCSRPDQLSSYC